MRFIPRIKNKRSVIEINVLSNWIDNLIIYERNGLFLPQDDSYLVTNELIKVIRASLDKKTSYSLILTIIIQIGSIFSSTLRKVYRSLYYKKKSGWRK